MTSVAESINTGSFAARENNTRYAPFNREKEDSTESVPVKRRSGAMALLVALLLLSGVTMTVAMGSANVVEMYGGSQEGVLSIAWAIQGAMALLCFVFAVRWLRS